MNVLLDVLPVILYILLSILIVILIILSVKMLVTVKKFNKTIDDVNEKMGKLDGVFNLVDRGADALNLVTDKIVVGVANGVSSLFKKKNKKKEEEDNEDE